MPTKYSLRLRCKPLLCHWIVCSSLLINGAGELALAVHPEQPLKTAAGTEVVLVSEVKWRHLNPARGDASPAAGTLWGDQTEDGESGFLVKFQGGFSSPPHVHNITYRGIVIAGALHNDDPGAEPMWMPAGSWWTQPAGEVHLTAARTQSVAYVEIQSGPYLVKGPDKKFDNGERPVNMDSSNIVWLDAADLDWIESKSNRNPSQNAQVAFLWGQPDDDGKIGTMLKLPAGFTGILSAEKGMVRVVVVQGKVDLSVDGGTKAKTLPAGSYFGSNAGTDHRLACEQACVVYVRSEEKFNLKCR
ncbi:DUF4437 domain-containing protein [Roseiconus lacunae]|uniref:DUF4437 domain-containing protein n=1 Tax=Roseiconus lacunae TaxID=2605694 RepID=UPI001E29F726|nr:DUF4437 domain-containing protein [Roseiconus lacunae]MCD0462544.1 DUF4437 domain-containing protein [Roseiconus lacunae]